MKLWAVFTVLLMTSVTPSLAETAGEVSGWCQPFDNAVVNPNGEMFVKGQTFNSSFCWGAFEVVQQLSRWGVSANNRYLNVCSPPDSDRLQMVHIFRHYLQQHPEKEHVEFTDIAVTALREAFPCK